MNVTQAGVSEGFAPTSGNYFFLKDGLGSITEITNSTGQVVQKYSYSSFGKIFKIENAGVDNTESPDIKSPFTYTNREYDSESGLYYYRARYYDAHVGRFLQEDPHPGKLGSPLTHVNKYIYTSSNPINLVDPSGLFNIGREIGNFFGGSGGWVGDLITAAVVVGVIVASGGTLGPAMLAVASVAGGAALAAGTMAAFQGGNFFDNFSSNFHTLFRVSATFLAVSAIAAPGGVTGVGGNGIQGYVTSGKPYFGAEASGLTIGSSATYSGAVGPHEFAHTLQFIGMAGVAGYQNPSNPTSSLYISYGITGGLGAMGQMAGVPNAYNPFEFFGYGL